MAPNYDKAGCFVIFSLTNKIREFWHRTAKFVNWYPSFLVSLSVWYHSRSRGQVEFIISSQF